MPCLELFQQQGSQYINKILLPEVTKRIVIEAGSRLGWGELVALEGKYITLDCFGASALANHLFKKNWFHGRKYY